MLIADLVSAVSQGDFFGSKICQGMHAQLEAAILTSMHDARYILGLLPVRISRDHFPWRSKVLVPVLNTRCISPDERNVIFKH